MADRIRVTNWGEVAFILTIILITVNIIDLMSKTVRHRMIPSGEVSTRSRTIAR